MTPNAESGSRRLTWLGRLREDAREEFRSHANALRYSRPVRWWKRHVVWSVEGWLLAWAQDVEPTNNPDLRFLAEDDSGDWLMPRGIRDGMPWWQGYWRWWRPDHWPVYLRTRRARTYVMVERCSEW